MKPLVILSVILIVAFDGRSFSCQESKMLVKTALPTFSIVCEELEEGLNSFIMQELACHSDNPDLIFSIRLFEEYIGDTVVVVTIQSNKSLLSVIDLHPDGIKYMFGHQVFLFNIDANDLVKTYKETVDFTYEKEGKQSSKSAIPIISIEDDRYSMITFFFKDGKLRLYEKSIKCP